jgi:type I restriction enzyme S subunit
MIEDLKPYPKYKGSGLAWLGEIPMHWEVKRGKSLFSESNLSVREDDEIVTCFRDGQVTLRKNRKSRGFMLALYEEDYQGIREGQLVIHAMDAFAGAIRISDSDGKCTPEYIVLNPRTDKIMPGFYSELLRHVSRQGYILASCPAVRERAPRFRYPSFASMQVPLPPPGEQKAIYTFLSRTTSRLDRAIRAKRRIIALLNEQKQAIIHSAVTRGLDPSVPLKDSGVPWLGEIPEHWGVDRLKGITTPIEQGWSPQCDAQPSGEDEWGVLKVGCVNRDAFDEQQNKKLPAGMKPPTALEIRDGDILVSRANTRDLLGLAAVAIRPRPRLLLCDKLFRFRANPAAVDAKFLVYTLRQRTSRAQIESSTNGASDSMQNIGQGVIRNLMLSVPPLQEQLQILEALQIQTAGLMTSISRAEQELLLLQEYRTRLIADVVTGKLDVREVAAQLPVELDAPEEIDESIAEDEASDFDHDDPEADLVDT